MDRDLAVRRCFFRTAATLTFAATFALGCQRPYRVGERVKVLFDKKECPGFITEIRGRSRFQVHFTFEGYVWDEAVSLDRVKGVAEDTLANCQPPERVARALGIRGKKEKEAVTPYKVGDRIRVRWRESAYPATVLEAIAADKLRIHYDGYDEAWDEVIPTDRILSREQ